MNNSLITPAQGFKTLSRRVKGQNELLKTLFASFYEHGLNHASGERVRPTRPLAVVGNTGCGKSYAVEEVAQLYNMVVSTFSAAQVTQNGFVGASISDIVGEHYERVDPDESSVLIIDEFDKIRATGAKQDVGGAQVQFELLLLVEGRPITLGRTDPETVRTDNLLIIFAGAFAGLRKEDRSGRPNHSDSRPIRQKELIRYGMIPELVGRLGTIVQAHPMSQEILTDILDAENSPLEEYIDYFRHHDILLKFTEDAKQEVARRALKLNIGARGLGQVLSSSQPLLEWKFNAPELAREGCLSTILMDSEALFGNGEAEVLLDERRAAK